MKTCTMNCGPALGDTRTEEQRRASCEDCIEVDPPQYHLTIADPREFTKEIARHMRQADAPLSEHQVITLYHYLEARSTPE